MKKQYWFIFLVLFCFVNSISAKKDNRQKMTNSLNDVALSFDSTKYVASDSLIQMGVNCYDNGDYDKALYFYKKVNTEDKSYNRSLYEMALTYLAKDDKEKALECINKIDDVNPETLSPINFYDLKASIYDDLEMQDKAIAIYDSLYPKYKYNATFAYNYGVTCIHKNDLKKAREILEFNIRTNPYHYNSVKFLGFINYMEGKLVPALLCFSYASFIGYTNGQLAYDAYDNFESSINGLLTDVLEKNNLKCVSESSDDVDNQQFKDLEFFIKNYASNDTKFKVKSKVDFATTRQLQFLMENVKEDESLQNVNNQIFIPFLKEIVSNGYEEEMIYYFLRFSSRKDVAKIITKSKGDIIKFANWAFSYINNGRTYRFDPKEENRYSFQDNVMFFGKYKDEKKSIKTGKWDYYINGAFSHSYNFVDDKKNGKVDIFDPSGIKKAELNFVNDKAEEQRIEYYNNGNVSASASLKNDEIDGLCKLFYPSGDIKEIFNKKGNIFDGKYISYYPNGTILKDFSYKNDKIDGDYYQYHENGKLFQKLFLRDGIIDGPYEKFYTNGQKSDSFYYENGKINGIAKQWNPNGSLISVFEFNKDIKIKNMSYYSNGVVSDSTNYDSKGNFLSSYLFDDRGKLSIKIIVEKKFKTTYFYDENGSETISERVPLKSSKSKVFNINQKNYCEGKFENLERVGEWVFYDYYGNVTSKDNYKENNRNGESNLYYSPIGVVSEKLYYENSLPTQKFQHYYKDGSLSVEGFLVDGEKRGEWTYYYPNKVVSCREYYDALGLLSGKRYQFDMNGKLFKETKYDFKGNIVCEKLYDENGAVIDSCSINNGSGKIIHKSKEGRVIEEFDIKNGKFNGKCIHYGLNGSKLFEYNGVNGEENGQLKKCDVNGNVVGIFNFISGKQYGESVIFDNTFNTKFISYYSNSICDSVKEYNKDGKIVYYKTSHNNGKDKLVSYYDNKGNFAFRFLLNEDLYIGIEYFDKGNVLKKVMFEKGKNNVVAYYPNGTKALECTIENGWREGSFTKWSLNGNICEKRTYKNDELDGVLLQYNDAGVLMKESNYVNNVNSGITKTYTEKGIIVSEENFSNDALNGECKYYKDGKLSKVCVFRNDLLLSVKELKSSSPKPNRSKKK